jgi:subtilisin family serine protease
LSYQVVFNGLTVDPGEMDKEVARRALAKMDGVKHVYLDYARSSDLYTSTQLINAPAAWDSAAIGGRENAGAGIKVASMDGGVHHEAPMFDGTDFDYPDGYPPQGLGWTQNNNGKIIASRVYFRSWDPPAPGDENPWPGENGTSHGVHTASTAAGNVVTADYAGVSIPDVGGVAPAAWVMSYRVFYYSVTADGSFYDAEGIAALEDIVMDGADVLNNSWGGGPGSLGGEFDPLDTALINAANAGIFVSMSNGNSGPSLATGDHPSDEYINVAASTTSGTLASGRLSVTAPEPTDPALQDMAFTNASFGPVLEAGNIYTFTYKTSESVDPTNFEGCNPWPAGTFTGYAAVISRGTCEFGLKVLNAENAGAEFVVIYNHATGGDELINMGGGAVGHLVTIPSIFVGHTDGLGIVAWHATHGDAAILTYDAIAFQAGNTPDRLASFSSRGPGVGNVLKPDITAPGVNILAQGYAPGTTGEDRHLGWGQASGTSMAAPHVTGAAALLRQIHPDWSNASIKSALMSTSKYLDVYDYDGSPAQPLEMGAGRLDLTHAADPGVILSPPSLSFGLVVTGTTKAMDVMVTSVATQTESYTLSTLYTGDGFGDLKPLAGFTVSPTQVTLDPGEMAQVTVTFDPAQGMGFGDNQGFIIMDGETHHAHMPAWARVTYGVEFADVLVIDNDSSWLLGFPDYQSYYTDALDNLGLSYEVWITDYWYNNPTTLPTIEELMGFPMILYFTGDNYYPDGYFTVATPLTEQDQWKLNEYANNGGILVAMGQDMSAVLGSDATDDGTFFYSSTLGGNWLQDSVTGYGAPAQPVTAVPSAPEALQGVMVDLSVTGSETVELSGANVVPQVTTDNSGWASFSYDQANQELSFYVNLVASDTFTVTAAHVHSGTVGVNGPVEFDIATALTLPISVTDTLDWSGAVTLDADQESALYAEGLYINIHTEDYPDGELRAQVRAAVGGDGAGNQYYIDELETWPNMEPDGDAYRYAYAPLLQYNGPYNTDRGVVAVAHRDQPSLERPGISYNGRSIYTSFGLEGVNNGTGNTSREDLLAAFMAWAMDEPEVTIADVSAGNASGLTIVEATVGGTRNGAEGVAYRWDWGDGSDFEGPYESNQASHTYSVCGTYTVRVEATNAFGNRTVGELEVEVDNCVRHKYYFPIIIVDSGS